MKLTMKERIRLQEILPVQGDFITMKKVRELRDKLVASDQEVKDYGIVVGENRITWTDTKSTANIKIGEIAETVIVETLKKMNDGKTLTDADLSLYVKFIENPPKEDDEQPA